MTSYMFSVCIPVYNTEQYLCRALDSICNQTFDKAKIEVIIVNDASVNTDDCDRIVEQYSKILSVCYIKKEKNEGLFLARKSAIENAHGEYLLFLDADDTFEFHTFEVLSKNFIDQPDYVQFKIYDVVDGEKTIHHMMLLDERNKTLDDVLQNKAIHSLANKCYNSKFLKNIYMKMSVFYSVYGEDYYQSAIIEYYACKKTFIDIPCYNYFRYIGVTSNSNFGDKNKVKKVIESFQNIESNAVAFFNEKEKPVYAQYVKNYMNSLYINLAYWSNSLAVMIFIIKNLPSDYYPIRLKMLKTFFLHHIKVFIKAIMPYGLVQVLLKRKNKGNQT